MRIRHPVEQTQTHRVPLLGHTHEVHPPPPLDGVSAERDTGLLAGWLGCYHTATLTSMILCTELHCKRKEGGRREGRRGERGEGEEGRRGEGERGGRGGGERGGRRRKGKEGGEKGREGKERRKPYISKHEPYSQSTMTPPPTSHSPLTHTTHTNTPYTLHTPHTHSPQSVSWLGRHQ